MQVGRVADLAQTIECVDRTSTSSQITRVKRVVLDRVNRVWCVLARCETCRLCVRRES